MKDRTLASNLAAEHLAQGDPTGWFEPLYAAAGGDAQNVPWADLAPNEHLVQWLNAHNTRGERTRALVVGCGLGDDAEELSRRGFDVTAFDISPTAIAWCKKRFPQSRVTYQRADAMHPPHEWAGQFDFIHESYTLQAIPTQPRFQALQAISKLVAPSGSLLIICRARDDDQPEGEGPPWPLSHAELLRAIDGRLVEESFEDFMEPADPPIRRFRMLFVREA